MAPQPKTLCRTAVGLGLVVGLAAAVLACKGAPCPEELVVCASDGLLYCQAAPFGLKELDRGCCPNAVSPAAGPDASAAPDGGEPADAGERAGPDAARPGPAAGEWNDCTNERPDAGTAAEPRPEGLDDAGIPYIYRCGEDICHPSDDALPDAG